MDLLHFRKTGLPLFISSPRYQVFCFCLLVSLIHPAMASRGEFSRFARGGDVDHLQALTLGQPGSGVIYFFSYQFIMNHCIMGDFRSISLVENMLVLLKRLYLCRNQIIQNFLIQTVQIRTCTYERYQACLLTSNTSKGSNV